MSTARQVVSHIITVIAVGIIALVCVMLLAQNRNLSQEIKAQTAINQRYLRCILLIPSDEFKDVKTRVAAIDKCSRTSQLPDGAPVGQAPNQDGNKSEQVPSKKTTATPVSSAPSPQPSNQPVTITAPQEIAQANPQPQPTTPQPMVSTLQPTIADRVINTVKEVLPL